MPASHRWHDNLVSGVEGHSSGGGGRKFLRHALYMPAIVAARYYSDMLQKYQAMVQAKKVRRRRDDGPHAKAY